MTHSLHRQGTVASLRNDFVFLWDPAKGLNDKDIAEKALEVIKAAVDAGCINWADRNQDGGGVLNRDIESIKTNLNNKTHLRGVFSSKENITNFLKTLKEKDLGISLVMSGLLDEVIDACKEANLVPHTINFSTGVWGKKELLAPEDILAITTMCGHHIISPEIVQELLKKVRSGTKTAEEAAMELGKLCPCGLFNHVRGAQLLQELATK
ncbi:MAG: hypothetical protein ACOWWO_02115 [Peptococcaceae bacterium]